MYSQHHWSIEERIRFYLPKQPTARGCFKWEGATSKLGYPKLGYKGRNITVTRHILSRKLGRPLHAGMQACHTCDNPSCCTEAHLFEGTSHDNHMDMVRKGRSLQGERHHLAKLTEREVVKIRKLLGTTSHRQIAKLFRVSHGCIGLIANGKTWKKS